MSEFKAMKIVAANAKGMDPAIDLDKSNISEYAKTRDLKHLTFLDGMQPTFFVVKKVPATYVMSLGDQGMGPNLKKAIMFSASCHRVELGEGGVMEAELKEQKIGGAQTIQLPASDSWVTEITEEFGLDTVLEVGQVSIDFASLGKKNKPSFSYFPGSPAIL
jgi:hypothetical protein